MFSKSWFSFPMSFSRLRKDRLWLGSGKWFPFVHTQKNIVPFLGHLFEEVLSWCVSLTSSVLGFIRLSIFLISSLPMSFHSPSLVSSFPPFSPALCLPHILIHLLFSQFTHIFLNCDKVKNYLNSNSDLPQLWSTSSYHVSLSLLFPLSSLTHIFLNNDRVKKLGPGIIAGIPVMIVWAHPESHYDHKLFIVRGLSCREAFPDEFRSWYTLDSDCFMSACSQEWAAVSSRAVVSALFKWVNSNWSFAFAPNFLQTGGMFRIVLMRLQIIFWTETALWLSVLFTALQLWSPLYSNWFYSNWCFAFAQTGEMFRIVLMRLNTRWTLTAFWLPFHNIAAAFGRIGVLLYSNQYSALNCFEIVSFARFPFVLINEGSEMEKLDKTWFMTGYSRQCCSCAYLVEQWSPLNSNGYITLMRIQMHLEQKQFYGCL